MSKKKPEEKKEIKPVFEPALFWEYQRHSPQNIEKAETFLNTFSNELKALILPDRTIQQNYQTICEKAGYNVHPSLAKKPNEQSQFPGLKNHDYGEKYAIFLNHRIDAITLRLFGFVIQNFKLNSLKFSNNNLDFEAQEIKRILQRQDQLTTLYFEWNPIPDHPKRNQIFISCVRPSLHHLILRQCHLGNALAKELIKKIKQNPQNKLKSLDFYGNDLTAQIIEDISLLVEESKNLEFLGLSKNSFSSQESITRLFNAIGEIPLSQQQYQQHKLKEKARDQVIQRNKKRKKGTPEQPVPFVFEVKQTAGGKCYVKNLSLKILNLANNGLKDGSVPVVRKFIETNGRNIQLFIQGNKFSKTLKETLKFYQNVIA